MEQKRALEPEWQNTIRALSEKNASLRELKYFLDTAEAYCRPRDKSGGTPRVILIGHYFPDEILRAMDIDFRCVFGGSYESTLLPNVSIPKDSDDETRSLLGILRSDSLSLCRDDVVLVPLFNDSMKKLKALISDIASVVCFEVPPDKDDPLQRKRFENEIIRVTGELKKRFRKKLSSGKLKEQCAISKKAAETFAELEEVYRERSTALSASALLFVAGSCNMCKDKAEWTKHLARLIGELGNSGTSPNTFPEIMLLGAPIYAPNYKILFAVEEMKLRLHTIIHPDIEHIKRLRNADSASFSVKNLAEKYLESDVSPIYLKNAAFVNSVTGAIDTGRIKGVIAHIIKGQPLFDYEFNRIEQLTAKRGIPLNRIETVYNNGDDEQIRLRLEAFSEMLHMKHT